MNNKNNFESYEPGHYHYLNEEKRGSRTCNAPFVKPFSSHFSIRKVWKPESIPHASGVGVHVPAKPDVGVTTIPGLTTIPEAGKAPPDTSTTGAPDISLRLV